MIKGRKKHIESALVSLIVFFSMFMRALARKYSFGTKEIFIIISILSFLVICRQLFVYGKFPRQTHMRLLYSLWVSLLCLFAISYYRYGYFSSSITFFNEIVLSLIIFGTILVIDIKEELLIKVVARSAVLGGLVGGAFIMFYASNMTEIVRVGWGEILGALNHVGHAFVIAIVSSLYLFMSEKKRYYPIFFITLTFSTIGIFLTGSRAAIFAILFISIMFIFLYRTKAVRIVFKFCLFMIPFFIYALCIKASDTIGGLLSRFSLEQIRESAIRSRLSAFDSVFRYVFESEWSFLFGAGFHRYQLTAYSDIDCIPFPHNIFLSVLAHFGLFSFVALLMFTFYLTYKGFTLSASIQWEKSRNQLIYVYLSWLAAMTYSMTAGRITRIFTLAVFSALLLRLILLHVSKRKMCKAIPVPPAKIGAPG